MSPIPSRVRGRIKISLCADRARNRAQVAINLETRRFIGFFRRRTRISLVPTLRLIGHKGSPRSAAEHYAGWAANVATNDSGFARAS
jgi:hypothetical protein